MTLSKDEFDFLKSEVDKTGVLEGDDLKYTKLAHPGLYLTIAGDNGGVFYTEKSFVLSLENESLNKFICNKFDEKYENLYMIHRLIYGVGGYAKRHKDRFTTHKTISLILSDEFDGGDMYVNDKKVELNKKGDYVCFNGGNDWHSVEKVTKGFRDVLIIWFSKKQSKFTLI